MINDTLSIVEKIDDVIVRLDRIEKALKIVPDKDASIIDVNTSWEEYAKYADKTLKLQDVTIRNQRSVIQAFLQFTKGQINKDTVKAYLDSNSSPTWKTNQLKALRRYIRDFLKLGNWIEEFEFEASWTNIQKAYPTNDELAEFFYELSQEVQFVFMVLFNSGLRIGEVLNLQVKDIDFGTNMIDASNIHTGKTKSSRFSFITHQTADPLLEFLSKDKLENADLPLFSVSARSVQQEFKDASDRTGYDINPKLLRKVFADRCDRAGIDKKYTDAFCGRTSKTVLQKYYTDYSPKALREQYDKLEEFLTL